MLHKRCSHYNILGGLSQGVHLLEKGVAIAGTLKGAYNTAMAVAPYLAPLVA